MKRKEDEDEETQSSQISPPNFDFSELLLHSQTQSQNSLLSQFSPPGSQNAPKKPKAENCIDLTDEDDVVITYSTPATFSSTFQSPVSSPQKMNGSFLLPPTGSAPSTPVAPTRKLPYPSPKVTPQKIPDQQIESLFQGNHLRYTRALGIVGAFTKLYLEDNTIHGQHKGNHGIYTVTISFSPDFKKIELPYCSCPDTVTPCKHIGALLLTWNRSRHLFRTIKPLQQLIHEAPDGELMKALMEASLRYPFDRPIIFIRNKLAKTDEPVETVQNDD